MAYTEEERKLMDDILEKIHEYIDAMEKASEEEGKDFKSFLYKGDWFLEFCKLYKAEYKEDDDWSTAGLELGFIINFDMWVNDSNCWPSMPKGKNE
jgi:hypothetical protein